MLRLCVCLSVFMVFGMTGESMVSASDLSEKYQKFYEKQPQFNNDGNIFLEPLKSFDFNIVNRESAKDFILTGGQIYFGFEKKDGLKLISEKDDGYGNVFYKFQQHYHQIPVVGREVVLQVNKGRRVSMLSGNIFSGITLSKITSFPEKNIILNALSKLPGVVVSGISIHQEPVFAIIIINQSPRLVLQSLVSYQSSKTGVHQENVFVDAQTETVVSTETKLFR
ncbi:MAG: hypothetical protein HN826_16360 [Methylococcales bacterium]|nr:hypothetical protein [Methylococcales bacterium]